MTKKSVEFYFEIKFHVNKVKVEYLNIITADSEEMIENLIARFEEAVKDSGGEKVKIENKGKIKHQLIAKHRQQKVRDWRRNKLGEITVEEIVVDNESETQTVISHRLPVYLRANFEDREYFSFEIKIITQLSLGELEFKVVLPA